MWKYTNTTPDLEGGVVTRGGNAGNRLVTLYYPKDHLICTCGARVGASNCISEVRCPRGDTADGRQRSKGEFCGSNNDASSYRVYAYMYEDAERPAAHALSRPPQILMSVAYKVRWSWSAVVPYKTTSLRSSKKFSMVG